MKKPQVAEVIYLRSRRSIADSPAQRSRALRELEWAPEGGSIVYAATTGQLVKWAAERKLEHPTLAFATFGDAIAARAGKS